MSVKKLLFTISAICACSVIGYASDDMKCRPGEPCKVNEPKPLVVEPVDQCKGTVKCVDHVKYPNGRKTHMVVETKDGDKEVILKKHDQGFMPGDRVEVSGRKMSGNGHDVMMADQVKKNGTSNNLNNRVGD